MSIQQLSREKFILFLNAVSSRYEWLQRETAKRNGYGLISLTSLLPVLRGEVEKQALAELGCSPWFDRKDFDALAEKYGEDADVKAALDHFNSP